MKLHQLEQGSPQWAAFRSEKIGASDISAISNLNSKCTPYQLWSQKLGFETVEVTYAMQEGHRIEDEAREWFHKKYGILVLPAVGTHDQNDWALASFDGLSEDKQTILEIKHVKQEFHEMACSGRVPEIYFAQVQWQMYVAGLDRAYYLSYKRENPAVVIVHRDEDFISKAIPICEEFHRCVMDSTPPPLEDRDYIDVSDSLELTELAQRYKYYAAMEREHRDKANAIKDEMKELANDRNVKGSNFKLSKYMVAGRMDYEAIMKHHNINVKNCQQFKKPGITSYRITVK